MFKYSVTKLSSGLQVVRIPMPAVKSVTVLALCNTGSRYEDNSEEGIAHFFEHIVFKGTQGYPNPQILASAIDEIGAEFNAFTSKEYTGYYVKSASKDFERALDVVSDMLLKPLIRQEDIDREQNVIIEEINMYQDTPMKLVETLFERMIFKGSGLEHDVLGSKETVRGINRELFLKFLKKWYSLANMVVVVAGDEKLVSAEESLLEIKRYFAKDCGVRDEGRVDTAKISKKEPSVSDVKLHIEYKNTEQAHLMLGWPGLDRDDERRYSLTMLSLILGGNMSSRLFTEVREKRGLCYYVRADVEHYHNTGIFSASAGVDPTRIDEAITVIAQEFLDIANGKKLVTAQELKKAKEYMNGTMILGLEDSKSVAQFFGLKQVLSNKIASPEKVLEKLNAVTLDQVNSIAKELIKRDELRLVVIGPYKNKEKFVKVLKSIK